MGTDIFRRMIQSKWYVAFKYYYNHFKKWCLFIEKNEEFNASNWINQILLIKNFEIISFMVILSKKKQTFKVEAILNIRQNFLGLVNKNDI